MTDELRTVVIANAGGTELELLTRIVDAAGFRACPVAGGAVDGVVAAVAAEGAAITLLDVGTDNLGILEAIRSSDDAAVAANRVVVFGDGPANGRLAWQAGTDGLLLRPFHVDELRAALHEVAERPDDERDGARDAGLERLAR